MARKDALLRLTARLIARRDALRKALNGDLDSFRKFSELNAVGDNVDAAVDCANDEICSQLVEIESTVSVRTSEPARRERSSRNRSAGRKCTTRRSTTLKVIRKST
jgi:DnaK suppressor protein